jgi:polynucleotide 5'-kinase involved in rRNA processing
MQKELRKIPIIELETPTIVLVGAPNVGKSSIVRFLFIYLFFRIFIYIDCFCDLLLSLL